MILYAIIAMQLFVRELYTCMHCRERKIYDDLLSKSFTTRVPFIT